jgi:soluble lytic murein transglycosylase
MSHRRFLGGAQVSWLPAALASVLVCVVPTPTPAQPQDQTCDQPEDCYRAAFAKLPVAADTASQDAARLQRLAEVRERFPDSIWAKRASLAAGLLVLDRDPAGALSQFTALQRDLPAIEDYIRLWMGEALLKSGEAREAALQFERVGEAVPDSLLGPRVAYRAGEAWYRAGQCAKAAELLARAVLLGPQEPAAPGAWLNLAECHLKEGRTADSQAALRQLWIRYPQTQEAKEAERRLAQASGAAWHPTADHK